MTTSQTRLLLKETKGGPINRVSLYTFGLRFHHQQPLSVKPFAIKVYEDLRM